MSRRAVFDWPAPDGQRFGPDGIVVADGARLTLWGDQVGTIVSAEVVSPELARVTVDVDETVALSIFSDAGFLAGSPIDTAPARVVLPWPSEATRRSFSFCPAIREFDEELALSRETAENRGATTTPTPEV